MATALTVIALPTPWAIAPSALTFTTTDGAATFLCDGLTFLIANNTGVSTYTVTISSVADASTGRTADITADSLLTTVLRIYQIFPANGWRQSTGLVNVTVSNTLVKLAACRIAAGAGFSGVQ